MNSWVRRGQCQGIFWNRILPVNICVVQREPSQCWMQTDAVEQKELKVMGRDSAWSPKTRLQSLSQPLALHMPQHLIPSSC